eukprot:c11724_g2_i2.p1 GENE.c11724_g2_i2~~c11724_g2_i2.p1  ORF type:complete len:469 (-),score=76.88 c11724_g2_i2:38-1444(-)
MSLLRVMIFATLLVTQDYAAGRRVFDIHPPLSKLMLASVVKLSGFHTDVSYKEIGIEYKHDGYIWMRTVQALFGSTLAIFAFLSVRELGGSLQAAFFSGMLLVLELSFQTISRAVFMDPFLYFCIALGLYGALRTWRTNETPSSSTTSVIAWAFVAGLGMGGAFSTKHTGLGVIGVVGVIHLLKTFGPYRTQARLQKKSEQQVPSTTGRMFAAGVVMVVMIVSIYIASFIIHFLLGGEPIRKDLTWLGNVIDVNLKMLWANQRSVFHHHHGSQWQEWPILYRGLVYWWKHLEDKRHLCVYLFGNPLVYWLVLLALIASFVHGARNAFGLLLSNLRSKKPTKSSGGVGQQTHIRQGSTAVFLCVFGWVANYIPYPLLIKRTCFVYHYHPSLYFGILLCGVLLDYMTQSLPDSRRESVRIKIVTLLLALMLSTYVYYLPFSYALPLTDDEHEERRMMYFFPIFREIFPIW